jgi:hypothetical protein
MARMLRVGGILRSLLWLYFNPILSASFIHCWYSN